MEATTTTTSRYSVQPKRTPYDAEPLAYLGRFVKVVWYKSRNGYPVRCVGWIEQPADASAPVKNVMEKDEALNLYAAEAIHALREQINTWITEHDGLDYATRVCHSVTVIVLYAAEIKARAGGRFQASQLIGRRSIVNGNRFMDWWSEELYELAQDVEEPRISARRTAS